jgi:hypothetical protein
MSDLLIRRQLFTSLLPRLIDFMVNKGKNPCICKDGLKHMKNSLHYEGLAEDFDFYDNEGVPLTKTEDHKECGEFWKTLHPYCCWGGDFSSPDGDHYSITYQGRK